ncbi:MAG: NADPH:quinone oxidoreductase family protein [Nannocystaceae bacterium]|nr:NADPH:quinone oxidoreductase family protein [Myxococcales bacterium]
MRAAMVTALDGPGALELRDVEDPTPGPGQVVIDVAAAGVNFPDLLMTRGLYQLRPDLPFSPGGEIAGRVAAVGAGVTGLAIGDRVMALTFFGGFAAKVAVYERLCVPVPEGMDDATAGAFAFTYATSYHALVDRGRARPGERLLVLGAAGGVGLAAVEIGAALGLTVIAAASTEEKLDLCQAHGAAGRINYATSDLKQAAKALGGVDIVYDPVGGDYSEPALRALKPGGRHLVIGFAAGSIPSVRLNLALLKECEIIGVAWGAWALRNPERHRANMDALCQRFVAGELRPHVSRRYPLAEASAALEAMERREVHGKVVLEPRAQPAS